VTRPREESKKALLPWGQTGGQYEDVLFFGAVREKQIERTSGGKKRRRGRGEVEKGQTVHRNVTEGVRRGKCEISCVAPGAKTG